MDLGAEGGDAGEQGFLTVARRRWEHRRRGGLVRLDGAARRGVVGAESRLSGRSRRRGTTGVKARRGDARSASDASGALAVGAYAWALGGARHGGRGGRVAGKDVPARGVLTVLSTEWLRVGPRGFVLGRARSG